jgi:GNAT superfamily N-acetyltransferase
MQKETAAADATVSLRPVGPDDEAFVLEVYASSRAMEMALVPWDEAQKLAFLQMQCAAQQKYYLSEYPDAEYSIILLDNHPVGRIYVLRREEAIKILDITLMQEYRNRGTGTALLQKIMSEAALTQRPVQIYVETFNPSLSLFARLGFSKIGDEGVNYLLEWRAAAAKESSSL